MNPDGVPPNLHFTETRSDSVWFIRFLSEAQHLHLNLSELITPATPAGTALFLQWQGYHVFSIPQREIRPEVAEARFFGVGGKRQATELLIDCALREGREEIGAVISQICSAEQTYLFRADGTIQLIELTQTLNGSDPNQANIRPRLILEKRRHSTYGSMADQNGAYYLVGFNATLSGQPQPSGEIAGLLYLQDHHLAQFQQTRPSLADLLQQGAQLDCQPALSLDPSLILLPHGTAQFLIAQMATK